MQKSLDKFALGETGRIEIVLGEKIIRRRLLDMGLTPGANVTLKKKAPLGDPLQISVRGYNLTLRKSEASLILFNK
ncbi:MAG: ferrous iron transport protein A [Bacilli bacterium]|nr:ferrous iron transport protein A [Bacilli bacterium]